MHMYLFFIQEKIKHKNAVEQSQILPWALAHELDIPLRGSHCFTIFKRIKLLLPLQRGALAMRTGSGVLLLFWVLEGSKTLFCGKAEALWAVHVVVQQEKILQGVWRGCWTGSWYKILQNFCTCVCASNPETVKYIVSHHRRGRLKEKKENLWCNTKMITLDVMDISSHLCATFNTTLEEFN